jgi:hypothetical protein
MYCHAGAWTVRNLRCVQRGIIDVVAVVATLTLHKVIVCRAMPRLLMHIITVPVLLVTLGVANKGVMWGTELNLAMGVTSDMLVHAVFRSLSKKRLQAMQLV